MAALYFPHEVGTFGLCSSLDPRIKDAFLGPAGVQSLFNGLNAAVEVIATETGSDGLWLRVLDTLYAVHEVLLQVSENYFEPEMAISLFKFTLYVIQSIIYTLYSDV